MRAHGKNLQEHTFRTIDCRQRTLGAVRHAYNDGSAADPWVQGHFLARTIPEKGAEGLDARLSDVQEKENTRLQ